jgi:26S proteasome regulatory subunit N2
LARKRAKEEGDKPSNAMEIDPVKDAAVKKSDEKKEEVEGDGMDIDQEDVANSEIEKKTRRKREPEPTFFRVKNPARITKAQSEVCEYDLSQRYRPVRPEEKPFGVIVLTDSTPEQTDDDLGAVKPPSLEPEGEAAPPEPFEWTPPDHMDAAKTSEEEAEPSSPVDNETTA